MNKLPELRVVRITIRGDAKIAFFHAWSTLEATSPGSTYLTNAAALIEYVDGYVGVVPAQCVKFLDRGSLTDWEQAQLANYSVPPQGVEQFVEMATTGYNGCLDQAIKALRYLAANDRPSGGEEHFNSEHLTLLANEMQRTQDILLQKMER